MNEAALKAAPLQDAVDLKIATDDERQRLKAWKLYRVKLNRIEQQPGFPAQVDWPKPSDQSTVNTIGFSLAWIKSMRFILGRVDVSHRQPQESACDSDHTLIIAF
ncbi:tail fiber assembly protein [Mycoavidus sp. SF9855]|uniref:tail fiber assembly protein n=1 Tax=Mycoavidus sp. SF9855 TaxID=2968475 RepID=UPI00279574AD|nr:tail fiber assembly protein [Mycoavidus sp. SF9855]